MSLNKENKIDFPIDIVYTWVDDSDDNWKKKRNSFLSKDNNYNKDAVDVCRFYNNDELKYSLRSIEKYASWINNIFIVTDNQKPDWLNLENPKIHIINHQDIIPENKLPTYNACTIENAIPYIKELNEHFLYANDDMFFWNNVEPSFFFEGDKSIFRIKERIKKNKKYKHLYGYMIYRAYELAKTKFHKDYPYFSHHNIDSYKKSLCLECLEIFKEEFEKTRNNRFRDFSDLQRTIMNYYALSKNSSVIRDLNLNFFQKMFSSCESEYFNVKKKYFNKILNSKAKLVCLNDSRKTTNEDRKKCKELLENKFSNKSEFEK